MYLIGFSVVPGCTKAGISGAGLHQFFSKPQPGNIAWHKDLNLLPLA
ncbi:MAG: hypothetical protein ACOY9Y_12655 [Bacillota bacterium]